MDIEYEVGRLRILMEKASENLSEIMRMYSNVVKEKNPTTSRVVPFLNQFAVDLLSSQVITILKKHRLEAYSYILVANNLIDLDDLKDDLLNGDVLAGNIPYQNAIRNLKKEFDNGSHLQPQIHLPSPPEPIIADVIEQPTNQKQHQLDQETTTLEGNRLALKIINQCRSNSRINEMTLYKLPLKEESLSSAMSSVVRRFSFGDPDRQSTNMSKTILLMGATGSGKTTMINAMINYILGVEWDDPFRFVLVDEQVHGASQAFSQTREVTAYDIHYRDGFRIPYSLTIVDTPGFGDTEGLERDNEITLAVKLFFEHEMGIQELNAVGFVVQSSLARLTSSQIYIFNSVLSIFGKDIKDNIRFLATFDNGGQPLVLGAIKEAKIPCLIGPNGLPSYQCFNNGSIFVSNRTRNRLSLCHWEDSMINFKSFFAALSKMPVKSLQLSQEVLSERESLHNMIAVLNSTIQEHLMKMEELRSIEETICKHKYQVDSNKNFEFTVNTLKKVKVSVDEETAMNCLKCEMTCHYPCNLILPIGLCPAFWRMPTPSMEGLANAAISFVSQKQSCKVCPEKCSSDQHRNEKTKWILKQVEEIQTLTSVRQKYEEAVNKKLSAEELKNALQVEIDQLKNDIIKVMQTITLCTNKLKENVLRGSPLTTSEYIQSIIDNEQKEKKSGYMERIQNLKDLLEKAKSSSQE